MNELSYLTVGEKEGLTGRTLNRYVEYMTIRWKDEEKEHCRFGYAKEWALRFKNGDEYPCSDFVGQFLLKEIDKEIGK